MKCNCAGTAPGYPQHEAYCGQEPDEDPKCWAAFCVLPAGHDSTHQRERTWLDDQLDAMCADAYRRYIGWTVDED